MYWLTFDRIKNRTLLDSIYTTIQNLKMYSGLFIEYQADATVDVDILKRMITNFISVRLSDIQPLSEDNLDNFVLDLVESQKPVLFKQNIPNKMDLLEEMAHSYGLKYRYDSEDDLTKPLDLGHLSYNDLYLIYDLFAKKHNTMAFTPLDFLIHWTITENGDVLDSEGKIVLNLKRHSLIELLLIKPKGMRKKLRLAQKSSENIFFNQKLYEPWPFLREDDLIFEKIIAYKKSIFESVKNIYPEQYPSLQKELWILLNDVNYLPMTEIIKDITINPNTEA